MRRGLTLAGLLFIAGCLLVVARRARVTQGVASADGWTATRPPVPTEVRPTALRGTIGIAPIVAVVIWSGIYPGVKIVLQDFSPASVGLIRLAAQPAVLFAILWLTQRRIRLPARSDLPLLVVVGAAFATNQLFFAAALDRSTASHTVMVYGATPLLTVLLAWISGQERPRLRVVGGVLVSLFGLGLIVGRVGADASPDWLVGDLLIFAGMVAWVGTNVGAVPLLKRMSPLEQLAWCMALGAIFIAPFGLPDTLTTDLAQVTPTIWLAVAYIVFGNLIGALLWNREMRRFGASQPAVYFNLQPICGVLLSVALLGERLVLLQVVGSLVVIGGILIARRREAA